MEKQIDAEKAALGPTATGRLSRIMPTPHSQGYPQFFPPTPYATEIFFVESKSISFEKTLMWERLRAGGEGDDRG